MAYNPILGLPPGVTAGTSQKSMEDSRGNNGRFIEKHGGFFMGNSEKGLLKNWDDMGQCG